MTAARRTLSVKAAATALASALKTVEEKFNQIKSDRKEAIRAAKTAHKSATTGYWAAIKVAWTTNKEARSARRVAIKGAKKAYKDEEKAILDSLDEASASANKVIDLTGRRDWKVWLLVVAIGACVGIVVGLLLRYVWGGAEEHSWVPYVAGLLSGVIAGGLSFLAYFFYKKG